MRSIREEKFNKDIKNEFVYDFDILEKGLYIIEISARAKNWLQNTLKFISFFQDDDLAVKIDDKEFPKLNGKRGLFDSETAWNGNKLSGLQQTNIFLINLETGQHSLHFFADQLPLLETVRIYHSQNQKTLTLNQFPINTGTGADGFLRDNQEYLVKKRTLSGAFTIWSSGLIMNR